MRALTLIVLAAVVALPTLCMADSPDANPAKPVPSDEQATATPEATDTKPAQNGEETKEKQAFKPPPGFKPKILDWGVVYCKKMPVLGSRFPKQVCMNEAELKEYLAANDAIRRDKDQQSRICTGACNP